MAEENGQEQVAAEQAQTDASPSGTAEDAPATTQTEEKVDYKTQYEQLQRTHQETVEEKQRLEQQYDLISEHVDWDAVHGGGTAEEEQGDYGEDEAAMTKKEAARFEERIHRQVTGQIKRQEFFAANPELKPYEKIVSDFLVTQTNKAKPIDARLEEAKQKTIAFLKGIKEEAIREKEEAEKKKKQQEAAAAGFESTGTTPPAKPEDQTKGQEPNEYLAQRKAELKRKRGLGP